MLLKIPKLKDCLKKWDAPINSKAHYHIHTLQKVGSLSKFSFLSFDIIWWDIFPTLGKTNFSHYLDIGCSIFVIAIAKALINIFGSMTLMMQMLGTLKIILMQCTLWPIAVILCSRQTFWEKNIKTINMAAWPIWATILV